MLKRYLSVIALSIIVLSSFGFVTLSVPSGMGTCSIAGYEKVAPYFCLAIDDSTGPLPRITVSPPDSVCANMNFVGVNAAWANVDKILAQIDIRINNTNAIAQHDAILFVWTDAACTNIWNDVGSYYWSTREFVAVAGPGSVNLLSVSSTSWLPMVGGRVYYDDTWTNSHSTNLVGFVIIGYLERH